MDRRPFGKLPEPRTRSSNRYKIESGRPAVLVDTERKKTSPLDSHLDQEAWLENLAHDMTPISNFRIGRYDPLLNCVEAWTKVYYFVIESFPALLAAGALQPLVDLDACLHDLTIRKKPCLVSHRHRWMDGGYRTLEEILELQAKGESPREPTDRPVRSHRDLQEGRVVLVLEALKRAYPKEKEKPQRAEIDPILKELLNTFDICTIDDVKGKRTTTGQVWSWARTVKKNGRSGGRRYTFERLKIQFGEELSACSSKEYALQFAREQLERVRCRQPTNRPLENDQTPWPEPNKQRKPSVAGKKI